MPEVSSGHWEWARQRLLRQRLARSRARAERLPRVGDTVGGFVLEARLGAGSYGTVFRVRRGERAFALKLLYLPLTGAWAWRELEVALRLHHVGLLDVECHGHHGFQPGVGPLFLYLVTPYVPGLALDTWAEHTNPTARQVARTVGELGAQLGRAHAAGVVHRDLKADNVVVRREDARPVLVDFGVGTFPGALRVTEGPPPGNARTRPPELWRFRRERRPAERYASSARDDLWALGVLFYWLLVGAWPFSGETEEELEDAVLRGEPPAPVERNPRVPGALSAVCLRMLEPRPEARYPDTGEVCQALEAALAGADAAWDVPLCAAWDVSRATTQEVEVQGVEEMWARDRRLAEAARVHEPMRGKPLAPPDEPASSPEVEPPADTAARVQSAAGPMRSWRRGVMALGALSLLCAAHLCTSPRRDAGQEMASLEGPPEGEPGAAPPWAFIPAPVASATHSQDDMRVKTSTKNSLSSESKPREQAMAGGPVIQALCMGALGAFISGCASVPVRTPPPPEACPADTVASMVKMDIHIGTSYVASFPGHPYVDSDESVVTLREGTGVVVRADEPLGTLPTGMLLSGHWTFGKERVYARLTEAQVPGGPSYPVCIELWDVGGRTGLGLVIEPGGTPGTATVNGDPLIKPVERFN